ncbi:MAG: redoxin domain-containing protein [Chloroflexi bacterium]|nr:redoxin domain-containing protein [Chloroflexota bacterium]
MSADNLTLGLAFIAGLVSFISPCVLPLVPAYIGYMGGRVTTTVAAQVAGRGQLAARPSASARFTTVLHGLAFVAGFTFVFVTIGLLSTAFVQQIGGQNISLVTAMIGRLGGVVIIFFGLHFMGVLPQLFARLTASPRLLDSPLTSVAAALLGTALILWGFAGTLLPPLTTTLATTAGESTSIFWPTVLALIVLAIYLLWLFLGGAFTHPGAFWRQAVTALQTALYTDTRRQMDASGHQGLSGSAIMGVVFSAGWTPCIGPVYGAVLTLAANTGDVGRAGPLLAAYSLGLGIPFLLTALLLDSAQGLLRRLQRHMRKIELVSGGLLIFIGVLVATGTLQSLSQYLSNQFAEVSIQVEQSVLDAITGDNAEATPEAGDGAALPSSGDMALAGAVGFNSITGAAESVPAVGTDVGNLAPNFEAVDDTGKTVKLSSLRGQVVLVNFWATWCGPCRLEMPEFERAFKTRAADGFTILAVNNQETPEDVRGFREEMNLSFPLLLDESGAIQTQYGIKGYPSTFLVNRQGVIVARFFGPMTAAQIEQAVNDALAS